MPERNLDALMRDILDEIERVERFTENIEYQDFFDDEKTRYAVIRCLEVIGEAVKHFPKSLKQKHPEIEWRKISGLRDILIHEYFKINSKILWDIVQNKIPELKHNIQEMIEKTE
jgi:uncharacterized protein with HEPN domain